MSDVKWIKLSIDMFENRKIRHLRKLPDGNNIVLIWVMLLSLAGKCNAGGMIFLTENIPYTPKMLADELDFEENTVILALDALERFGMIRRDGFLVIEDWDSHQNAEGLDKIREQTRKRVARYRENQKALQSHDEESDVALSNVTGRYEVTQSNAPRIRNREEDIEKEDTPLKGGVGGKKKKAFVPPTLEEVKAYCKERNSPVDPKQFFEYFDVGKWIDSKGEPVRNWKQKLITWEQKGGGSNRGGGRPDRRREEHDYDADTEGVL